MDCKDYQDLLIQLPFNELNEEETAFLMNHLNSCEKCSAELKRNKQLVEFTRKLSLNVPENHEKHENIISILNETKSQSSLQYRKPANYRIIRIVINTAAVFLIGLFLFQQMEMKWNLENLNAKIENQNQTNFQNDLPISIKQFAQLDDNQIDRLLSEYEKLLKENKAIIEYLKLNHPEVYKKLKEMKNLHEL